MATVELTVGELAKQTGVTVRTLHHYDSIGLLRPSKHTAAGYRLYTAADITRLQQVMSLRQIGFTLEEVRACLDRDKFSPLEVVRLHASRLREQIELQAVLAERLDTLAEHLAATGEVSAAEFTDAVAAMTVIERHCPAEAWSEFVAEVFAEMATGTDPTAPRAAALARRCSELMSGADQLGPGFADALSGMCESGEAIAGVDPAPMRQILEYLRRAADAAGIKRPA